MKYLIIPLIIVGFIGYGFADSHIDETVLTWSQANYKIENGTGAATIIVNDSEKNENRFFAEKVKVFVYSDSFREGILIDLYETEKDSGKFERRFTFSDTRSAPNILLVREGDTATAIYPDKPLPSDYLGQPIEFTATTLIGSTGPPLERVPASSFRIKNMHGDVLKTPIIQVDKQIQLVADIKNQQNRNQSFVFFLQIQDENKATISLSWITGALTSLQSFSPSQSWIPQNPGKYTATIFVWQSFDNPTALSPPVSLEITVKD